MSLSPRTHPLRRVLALCPALVFLLWVAGVAQFRGYELASLEWVLLLSASLGLHVVMARARASKPIPALPPGTTPRSIAGLAAAILAALAGVLGGVFEWAIEPVRPSETSWSLRTTWHAACIFAASYTTFLHRLQDAPRAPTPPR